MKIWKIESSEMFLGKILDTNEVSLSRNLQDDKKEKYYESYFELNKRRGKRKIYSVDKQEPLFQYQQRLTKRFLNNILLSDSAFGFVKGYNYLDFLQEHVDFYGDRYFVRFDIKNFFGTITQKRIKEVLDYYVAEECGARNEILTYMQNILLYRGELVQGAPSSPAISNIIFRQIDIRLQKYCLKYGAWYSRYVDDLLFSSTNKNITRSGFLSGITKILSDYNFALNYDKTIKSKGEISLGGFVVSDDIRISRKKLENINRVLFYMNNKKFEKTEQYIDELNNKIKEDSWDNRIQFTGLYSLQNYLAGNRAFLIELLKYSNNQRFISKLKKIIDSLESKLDIIEDDEIRG